MTAMRGGEKLQAYLRKLAAKVANPGTLQVGFLEGATYPNGTSVPMVAAVQEFGSPAHNIPPRPFMRPVVAAGQTTWGKDMSNYLKATNYNGPLCLGLMGAQIEGEIRQAIQEVTAPPLAPATIAAKGFAKPLIDTGVMFQSVSSRVQRN